MPECVYCGLSLPSLLEEERREREAVIWRCSDRASCRKRSTGDETGLVHATWSRGFPGITVLAFADKSYLIYFGSKRKPPLVEVGWCRWRPNLLAFPRRRRVPGR